MKQTVNLYQFRDAFNAIRPDNFTYDGLQLIFEFQEEADEDYELDVIDICCAFSEDTPARIADDYGIELDPELGLFDQVTAYLEDHTIVIGATDETIVYLAF